MNQQDAEEFTRSLGQIVSGSWRQIALAKRLGVPQALGLSVDDWVRGRLGGYVKMAATERIEAVKNLTEEGHSSREIGEILGISHTTAANDVKNFTPIDAVAALAANEKVTREIERKEKERQRQEENESRDYGEGCTVEDLQILINSGKKFGVIYADPPWEFKVYSGKGKSRSADRHYETQGIDWIKSLPVEKLAAHDCALLLWSVWPELAGAMDVINAWGFEYKTLGFVWVKQVSLDNKNLHWGMGYWTRANSEPCLLATRGSPQRQAKDVHQIVMSPVGEHSGKPEEVSSRIERLLPGDYLELFARRPMKGWTVWGNEVTRGLFCQQIPEFAP